jgi:hypothetical protein
MASKAAGRPLTTGVATWGHVAGLDGNILLIVNSPAGDEREVSMALDAAQRCAAPRRLHVIAAPAWQPWLGDRCGSSDRVLYSADAAGDELELNYFLESAGAMRWIVARQFAAIVGSAPHNLYNEEVKGIFERRVGAVLGAGRFLVHTLPEPYVYVLTLADLLQRFNRGPKTEEYSVFCRGLLADLHSLWTERGQPRSSDGLPFDDVSGALERHLGSAMLAWDEASPIPLRRQDLSGRAVEYLLYVEGVLHRAVDAMANLQALTADLQQTLVQLQDEINHRDRLLGELDQKLQRASGAPHDEIDRRDAIIAGLGSRAADLRHTIDLLQEETNARDRRLAELHDELSRETGIRDRRLAELHEELAREVGIRDGRLVELQEEFAREVSARDTRLAELHEELAREVAIRDRKLVEMHEERREAIALRDAIIDELRSGWRGWIVKRR